MRNTRRTWSRKHNIGETGFLHGESIIIFCRLWCNLAKCVVVKYIMCATARGHALYLNCLLGLIEVDGYISIDQVHIVGVYYSGQIYIIWIFVYICSRLYL